MLINPLASSSAGAPALKYGDVNTETTSPGEVKGLIFIKDPYLFWIGIISSSIDENFSEKYL